MKLKITLTPQQAYKPVQVSWQPAAMIILNNTPFSLLVRDGAQERPAPDRYDYLVPPGMYTTLPAIAHEFAFALDVQSTLVTYSYAQPCTVILASAEESMPDFGSSAYRFSQHFAFTLDAVTQPDYSITLDTRAARAVYLSIEAVTSGFGTQWWLTSTGYLSVQTGVTAADSQQQTFETASRVLVFPRSTPRLEAVIPLAANFTTFDFISQLQAPLTLNCKVDMTLLDTIPSWTPHYTTDYRWSEMTISGPQTGVNVFYQVFNGRLDYLEIAIQPPSPTADFDCIFYLHSGLSLQPIEVWRAEVSSSQKVTIAYGGPNALPTRQETEFLGYDQQTGAGVWRFYLQTYIPRFIRLMCDVLSSGEHLIHVGAHYTLEV